MTRFARARGSKSSNKREPEEATPWTQMKEGLLNKPNNSVDEKTQEILKCKDTLKNLKQEASVGWSTFEDTGIDNSLPKKKKKKDKGNENGDVKNDENEAKRNKKRKIKSVEVDPDDGPSEEKKVKKKKKKSVEIEVDLNENTGKEKKKKKKLKSEENEHTKENGMNGNVKKKKSNPVEVEDNIPEAMDSKKVKKKKSKGPKLQEKEQKDEVNNGSQPSENNTGKKNKKKKEFKSRRKPAPEPYQMDINGEMVDIVTYDGFPIMKEDAKRLDELKKSLYAKGIPRGEIKKIMKLQRRNAEKALSRAKKRVCFNCRKSGHNLSECPVLNNGEGTGICFKCGSTEHTHFECKVVKKQDFKFAQCFICKEQGHISNQCPDNPRGLYPKGGACKLCGDVTHLKRFCPTLPKDSEPTINNFLDEDASTNERISNVQKAKPQTSKIIRF